MTQVTCFLLFIFLGTTISLTIIENFERRNKRKEHKDNLEPLERKNLVDDVIHFDSRVEYATSLVDLQCDALQKIKAICGHLGVQVDIQDRTLIPSIKVIRSLSFMKEYLPEVEEQWQIFQNTDPESVLKGIKKKEIDILYELEKMPSAQWNIISDGQRREIIQILSNEYDRKHIMNENDQENLTAH